MWPSHLLMICAAKPRYTAAAVAAREHGRVFAPRLPTAGANVTSLFYKPREVFFEMCQRRVRAPGAVLQRHDHHSRQPGATLPPHALDHSGTPMLTSDYAVQGLVSTSSSRALATCLDVKGEGDTHVQRCVGLHEGDIHVQRCVGLHMRKFSDIANIMLCFEMCDGFVVLVQVHVASAEVRVRRALPRPVANLLCNHQVLRVVLDRLGEVPKRLIRVAEVPVFAIARCCMWYSMALA